MLPIVVYDHRPRLLPTSIMYQPFAHCLPALGRALLPVAASFAETGIVAGTVLFVLIAVANVYSNELLLWQSYATGHTEMEEVSGAIGGRAWRVSTAENPCALQSALRRGC